MALQGSTSGRILYSIEVSSCQLRRWRDCGFGARGFGCGLPPASRAVDEDDDDDDDDDDEDDDDVDDVDDDSLALSEELVLMEELSTPKRRASLDA